MATYIIRAGDSGPVKIGKADNPHDRLAALQTGHPDELVLLRVVDTDFDCEDIFHERFARLRIRGEWFQFDPEMMTFKPERSADPPIAEVIWHAKRRAVHEVGNLLAEIWQHFRGFETKGQFSRRIAKMLQVKERRIRAFWYGEQQRIDVHEIEGLRAIARKLRREQRVADAPLLSVLEPDAPARGGPAAPTGSGR